MNLLPALYHQLVIQGRLELNLGRRRPFTLASLHPGGLPGKKNRLFEYFQCMSPHSAAGRHLSSQFHSV